VLRITTTTDKESPELRLEGRIGGPWVDELRNAWSKVAERASAVTVDMRGVSYVDHRGAELLLEMEREGASIVNRSHFIRQLTQRDGDGKATTPKKTKRSKKEREHASTVRS
jgi:ABC-type transporter Mla MlaB component